METQLAGPQSAAFIPHRRAKYPARHRPGGIQVAASRFGIERWAGLVIGELREESFRFPALFQHTSAGIAGKIVLHAYEVFPRALLDLRRSLRISHREVIQSLAQTRSVQRVDRERANAALRASRTANQPGPSLARGLGQRGIGNLNQLGIPIWHRT